MFTPFLYITLPWPTNLALVEKVSAYTLAMSRVIFLVRWEHRAAGGIPLRRAEFNRRIPKLKLTLSNPAWALC